MDSQLTYRYPENFKTSDKDIFYFVDSVEQTPSFHLTLKSDCYWDVAHEKTINFVSDPLNISLAQLGVRKKLLRINKATWITDNYSANYFHWFNDALPKLIFLKEQAIHCEVLLLEHLAKISFITESLELLGWSYKVVLLNTICDVGELFLPTITEGVGAQHPFYFRKLCSSLVQMEQEPRRKIFISREDAGSRNVIPSKKFKDMLLSKGVEVIEAGSLSLKEQIKLFSECSHLIAVHGAGLTNMAFMPYKRGSILELRRRDDKLNYCYFKMANVLRHKYYYYLGEAEEIEKSVQQDNLIIDIAAVEEVLNIFLNKNDLGNP